MPLLFKNIFLFITGRGNLKYEQKMISNYYRLFFLESQITISLKINKTPINKEMRAI